MVDLDETPIGKDYHPNVPWPVIESIVEKKQALSASVGLNSDTPISTLRVWAQRFGMTGPLIGENSQIITLWSPAKAEILGRVRTSSDYRAQYCRLPETQQLTLELKDKANETGGIVAKKSLTAGLLEILDELIR